jgi:hypothetical protein
MIIAKENQWNYLKKKKKGNEKEKDSRALKMSPIKY